MVARPFFMTLPGYPGRMDEKEILNDLEYLQQTYPGEVRRCQRRIAEILDKYDYEGSMIYDEYRTASASTGSLIPLVRSWSGNREKSPEI